jgi:hypothetical protein
LYRAIACSGSIRAASGSIDLRSPDSSNACAYSVCNSLGITDRVH